MAKILIKTNVHGNGTVNYTHPDPVKDFAGVYKKGYPVTIRESSHTWGGKEVLPWFVSVNVTDATAAELEALIETNYGAGSRLAQSWVRKIAWTSSPISLPLDAWHLHVSADNANVSGVGALTQAMVENFITKWNGENITFAAGEVSFDIAVYEATAIPGALQSEGFWGVNTSGIVFNEISYTEVGGIHEMTADYSGTAWASTPERAQRLVEEKGGVVASNTAGVIEFTITRTDVLDVFKEEVREAVERTICRRQFRVSESLVDTITTAGGEIDVTLAQVETYILNRLDE